MKRLQKLLIAEPHCCGNMEARPASVGLLPAPPPLEPRPWTWLPNRSEPWGSKGWVGGVTPPGLNADVELDARAYLQTLNHGASTPAVIHRTVWTVNRSSRRKD